LKEQDFTSDRRLLVIILLAFVLMVAFAAADVMADLREGTTVSHVGLEGVVLAIGILGAALVARRLFVAVRSARESSQEARNLANQLAQSSAEAGRWRDEAKDLMRGLGQAIDEQFDRWKLSPAEKEVGLLLLKGLSHKEIAEARSVTEATGRQQAGALYKKAGLSGRHDLSAFFLEDLMLPPEKPK
jgi:DNA-binding NarL/FixJ family response regulator